MADNDGWVFLLRGDMSRNCGGRAAHAGKCEIVGDDSAPTGSSEMDGLGCHSQSLYRGLWFEITEERNESQE